MSSSWLRLKAEQRALRETRYCVSCVDDGISLDRDSERDDETAGSIAVGETARRGVGQVDEPSLAIHEMLTTIAFRVRPELANAR